MRAVKNLNFWYFVPFLLNFFEIKNVMLEKRTKTTAKKSIKGKKLTIGRRSIAVGNSTDRRERYIYEGRTNGFC